MLRHTAASLLAQSGVPVAAAAASLGHDPAIFLRAYAHLYPGDLGAVADAMDAARTAVIDIDGLESGRSPAWPRSGSSTAGGIRGDGSSPTPAGRGDPL